VTIEAVDARTCPRCGGELTEAVYREEPLLRGGGYGAARRTRRWTCPCGFGYTSDVTEVRPRPRTGR